MTFPSATGGAFDAVWVPCSAYANYIVNGLIISGVRRAEAGRAAGPLVLRPWGGGNVPLLLSGIQGGHDQLPSYD